MSSRDVRPIKPADLEPLAAMLGRAFELDPVFVAILPDVEHRRRALPALFREWIRLLHLPLHGSVATDDLSGAALWSPPGQWAISLWTLARMGPGSVAALGTRTLTGLRVLHALDVRHPAEPHHYLRVIGSEPSLQGQGIGSRLLAARLAVCDERHEPAYLESSNDKNLPFYRRHGFEVTGEVVTHLGPRVSLMWRTPR